jgi:hypothetical protein
MMMASSRDQSIGFCMCARESEEKREERFNENNKREIRSRPEHCVLQVRVKNFNFKGKCNVHEQTVDEGQRCVQGPEQGVLHVCEGK